MVVTNDPAPISNANEKAAANTFFIRFDFIPSPFLADSLRSAFSLTAKTTTAMPKVACAVKVAFDRDKL